MTSSDEENETKVTHKEKKLKTNFRAYASIDSTAPVLPFRIGHGWDLHRCVPLEGARPYGDKA